MKRLFTLILVAALTVGTAAAWGRLGHATVAKIAENHLTKKAKKQNVAYMCSESHPARCHRLLISNWLAAHGHDVCHIIHRAKGVELDTHQLGRWGAMPIIEEDHTVVYPELKERGDYHVE